MSSNQSNQTPEDIQEDYKKPRCTRTRDDPAFDAFDDFDECDAVINKKIGVTCGAPVWCHPSAPHSLCQLSRQDILSNEARWMTKAGLCIPCLQEKVCCRAAFHPSKDSIRPPSPPSPPSPPDRLSTSSKSSTESNNISRSYYFNNVDGTKSSLAYPVGGFRRLIQSIATEYGLTGKVFRVHSNDVKATVYGTYHQFQLFDERINKLQDDFYFTDVTIDEIPNQILTTRSFIIYRSFSRNVINGKHSNGLEEFDRHTVYSISDSEVGRFG